MMKGQAAPYIAGILLMFFALTHASAVFGAEDDIRIRITAGKQVLTATLEDNSTTRAFLAKLPLTLPMTSLYGREMCYRFDEPLPSNEVQTRNFRLGEIIYWPPRHSFVIMYRQDGERFAMQHIGQIDSGAEIFARTGNTDVVFELLSK